MTEPRDEGDSLRAADTRTPAWPTQPAVLPTTEAAPGYPVAPSARLGQRLGAFALVREIGHGGMGTVYLADRADGQFDQRVAIKVVRGDLDSERLLRAFRRERQILARLEHPHIARLLDGGLTPDGLPYFVMEHVDGEPITDYCARQQLPVEDRLRLFLAVCAAVDAAHQSHVVHRDLKPSNVLVSRAGEVKLLDFGIAKLLDAEADRTRTETMAMTPLYAAPEQLRGDPVTAATDVHALGLLLFEVLTGKRARRLERGSPDELVKIVLEGEPPRPSDVVTAGAGEATAPTAVSHAGELLRRRLRGDLDTIVWRTLQKEPARRYPTVAALAADLQRHLDGLPITARPASLAYRTGKLMRRRKAALAAGIVVLVAVAAATAGILHSRRLAARAPRAPTHFQLVSTFPGSHRAPSFSPDGKRVAYVDFGRGGTPEIWIKELAGGEPRQLTHGENAAARPRWSPRDDRIVFARYRQGLWSVPASGGAERQLVAKGDSPNLSADGGRLVYAVGQHIWMANADGSAAHEVEGVPPGPHVFFGSLAPALSPDGRSIAFFRCDLGPNGDLWVISSAGGEARQLTHDLRTGGSPVWTRDGRAIVYQSERAGSTTLWKVGVDGGEPVPLTTGSGDDIDAELDVSGRRLIYTNARDTYGIVATDPTTDRERRLLESKRFVHAPESSPDGRRITYFVQNEAGIHVMTMASDGSQPRQLTRGKGPFLFPRWSGDGKSIYYFDEGPRPSFRRMPATGGEGALVRAGSILELPSPDPAGRRHALRPGAVSMLDASPTVVRDVETGVERRLAADLLGYFWAPDGSYVAGFDDSYAVVACDPQTGACRKLAAGHSIAFAPGDSEHVYFLRGPRQLEDPSIGMVTVFVVDRDGKNERRVAELGPINVYTKKIALTPQGEILWVKLERGPHQLWMADLP